MATRRPNDPQQYDDLAAQWWEKDTSFAALHWIAAARAQLIPPPVRPDAVLLDVGCGGGLLAPHVRGYVHVGIDLVASALRIAAAHGVVPVRADATAVPVATGSVDVVVAGEVLEHLPDLEGAVREIARVLRLGGVVVMDTINDTWWARFSLVTVAEHLPGGPPAGIHDPSLFVSPSRLAGLFEANGVRMTRLWGLRPSARDYLAFLLRRRDSVRMLPVRSAAALYQAVARKVAA